MKKETKPVSFNDVMSKLNKDIGHTIHMSDLEDSEVLSVKGTPTGIFAIDRLTGIGGMPQGRIVELAGHYSSGKTALAFKLIASSQKLYPKKRCIFFDAENAIDLNYAKMYGVDIEKLVVIQPESLEECFESIMALTKITGEESISVCVVDSVAALVPRDETGENFMKTTVASAARQMSKAIRALTRPVADSGMTLLLLNQLRDSIAMYGPKEVTPGGKAIGFYSSMIIWIRVSEKIKKGETLIGSEITARMVKNKVGPTAGQSTTYKFLIGIGIDTVSDTIDEAINCGVISKSGNTYSFNEEKIAVGLDKTVQEITEDEILYEEIREAVSAKINNVLEPINNIE